MYGWNLIFDYYFLFIFFCCFVEMSINYVNGIIFLSFIRSFLWKRKDAITIFSVVENNNKIRNGNYLEAHNFSGCVKRNWSFIVCSVWNCSVFYILSCVFSFFLNKKRKEETIKEICGSCVIKFSVILWPNERRK